MRNETKFGYNELVFIPANSVHIPETDYNEGEGIKGVVGEDESTFVTDPLFHTSLNSTMVHSTYTERAEDAEFEVISDDSWKRGTWPVTELNPKVEELNGQGEFVPLNPNMENQEECEFIPGTGEQFCDNDDKLLHSDKITIPDGAIVKPGDCKVFGEYVCEEQCEECRQIEEAEMDESESFFCMDGDGNCERQCLVCKEGDREASEEARLKNPAFTIGEDPDEIRGSLERFAYRRQFEKRVLITGKWNTDTSGQPGEDRPALSL